MAFHNKCGSLVYLSNGNRTAQRQYSTAEFNRAVVLSDRPLNDNEIFEVKIDRRLNSWSGSIEVGVTACQPETVCLPASATGLKNGTWIMSGCNILRDGAAIRENYGQDLDKLVEGDRVGVMRTSAGILHFFVNGEDQGIAANSVPPGVYAVVDIYGKCVQVSISSVRQCDTNQRTFLANQLANEAIAEATALCSNEILAFHDKCGSLVRLTNENRTAERLRPNGEFNNGVVMTNRPLKQDELFEIRLDTMIDKWSGSIEVGITTHNPSLLDFPATMTNMRSGTIMMSGCGILTNGKGTQREYGQFNLDELTECDRIGLIRKRTGRLHFYINGIDQGVAAENAPEIVWGVVDLYGMAVKVTILDDHGVVDEEDVVSFPVRLSYARQRAGELSRTLPRYADSDTDSDSSNGSENSSNGVEAALPDRTSEDPLTFHPICGRNALVTNGNMTARRPNATDEFNHAVVLTNRPLLPGELFEIQINSVIDKWAGSVELGVTVHDPMSLEFPQVMNSQMGTWMMTGNRVMHNSETIIEDYGYWPDRMKAGDRVGVVRKANGNLYFTVNGRDLGLAATNVPDNVYGVLDLYGQASEASIVPPDDMSSSDLKFHTRHGLNCLVLNEGRSAARPHPREEFNDAIVMSNRPLRRNEMFEVVIDKMVDRWSGSLDCGVTTLNPETIALPPTMSDMTLPGTWILSGCSIVQEGSMARSRYNCDLEQLETGSRIGILVTSDNCLHFFLNGVDQGPACSGLPHQVYAVVDLYGTCAGVSITSNTGMYEGQRVVRHRETVARPNKNKINELKAAATHNHRFSHCCGRNISLRNEQITAARTKHFNNGVVFSADPIKSDELFEVRVEQIGRQWSGSLMIGLTTQTISESQPIMVTQATALDVHSKTKSTWIVNGSKVLHNGEIIRENYPPALCRVEVGSRVGIRRCHDGTMHVYVNGQDLGVAANHIPRNVFLILDIYGSIESVSIISQTKNTRLRADSIPAPEPILAPTVEEVYDVDTRDNRYSFASLTGKNVQLSDKDTTARRIAGYNQAIVVSSKPLTVSTPFTLCIDKLHSKWTSSLMVGVTSKIPEGISSLKSALNLNKCTWLMKSNAVFHDGKKVLGAFGPDLDSLQASTTIGLLLDEERNLHLQVNGADEGIAARDVFDPCYALVDLYGQCHQVSIVHGDERRQPAGKEDKEKADMDNSMKEKARPAINFSCPYQQLCNRFKQCISLPDEFFKVKYNKCFCEGCHKLRAGPVYRHKGNPPKEYCIPIGWYRYGLKVKPRAKSMKIFDNWNIAYSGAKVECIRKILDTGDLLSIENSLRQMHRASCSGDGEEKKPDTFESVPVILSPSIQYAGSHHFTRPIEYRDTKTDKLYQVKLAFEACVKPGSFNVGPQTLDLPEPQDPKLNSNEIEWATKERSSVEIYGLLMKLEAL